MSYDLGVLDLKSGQKKKKRTWLYAGIAGVVIVVVAVVVFVVRPF